MGKPRWVNKLFRETSWLFQKKQLNKWMWVKTLYPQWTSRLMVIPYTTWLVGFDPYPNHGHISKIPGWDHSMCPSFSSLSRGSAAAAVPWAIPFGRVWIPRWFGTMEFYDFPFSWEEYMYIFPTDEVIFFTGVGWNHQPDYHIWSLSYYRWQFSIAMLNYQRVIHEGWLIFIALPPKVYCD